MSNAAPQRASPPTIGRYELLHEIARGGMAVLSLAHELGIEGFEKLVVIKRILPELASRRDVLAMFLDEARIAALLQHPNLPHVYELVHQDNEYFFAMEYLHGADVRRLARAAAAGGGVPLEHAISIGIGLCAGLHYAHERRATDGTPMHLVHRDVSPRNVFVTYDGTVKLLDFGIAQAEHNRTQTESGSLKGTLQYMSPEQVHAGRVDRRSDIFSASVVLWELTVGRALFAATSDYSVLTAIAEREVPAPSAFRTDYPAALEGIVMKGLQRDPEQRFQTAEELQLALEQFAREHQLATSSVGLARFVRESLPTEVGAYDEACAQGTLVARAIEDVSTWNREQYDATVPAPPAVTEPPRRTRLLGDAPARRRWRAWLALVAGVAVAGSAIAWWKLASAPDPAVLPAAHAGSPAPPPPPIAPPVAPPPPPQPVAAPPPPPSKAHVRGEHRDPKRPTTPRPAGTKPLTDQDLDAAFPPKK